MGLYERLLRQPGVEKIPSHQFMAAMGELKRGRVTALTLAAAFNLDVSEQLEAQVLFARFNNGTPLTAVELHEVLLLAESGLAYTTVEALKNRLGV